jgi:spermidine synthase
MGAAYLIAPQASKLKTQLFAAGMVLTVALVGTFLAPLYDKDRFIQPFRNVAPVSATFEGADAFGKYLARSTDLLLWKDGPNTSVGIGASRYQGVELSRTIFINGKADGNTRGDYFTTVMLAHIPGLLQEELDHACIIGFGTGTTIGTLAQYPEVKKIDVVEIAGTVLNNAPYFDRYNNGASSNPKVHFNEMDAFRFFGGTEDKFNLIISEPSNPWVAGIENLYSQEFYSIAHDRLRENGVFVQWIHTYSFTDSLFRMVLRTMTTEFPTVYVFQLKGGDLALVGRDKAYVKQDLVRGHQRFESEAKKALDDAGLSNFESVLALEIVPAAATRAIGGGGEIHTLESPRLSNEAARAFYAGSSAKVQTMRRSYREYYASLDSSLLPTYLGHDAMPPAVTDGMRNSFCENPASKITALCEEVLAYSRFQDPKFQVDPRWEEIASNRDLASFDSFHRKIEVAFGANDLQTAYQMFESYKKYASPLAHIPPERFMAPVDQCLRSVDADNELYGECLLQKILVLETVPIPTFDINRSVNEFLDWFPKLSQNAPNYGKLAEARSILIKMASPGK